MLRFLSVIQHKIPHYNHAFIEKAQHLWRWISLRTLTRGRLVPRQPRAIKGTTRTELHGENIYIAKFIHWNNGTIPTALRCYNIYNGGCIHRNIGIFYYLFICMLALIVSKNARINAVGVTLFKCNPTWIQTQENVVHATDWTYQRRRCCAFDSPGLPNDSAGYPGLAYGLWGTTP